MRAMSTLAAQVEGKPAPTLLSQYATQEEIVAVRDAHAAIHDAEIEEHRVVQVLGDVERQILAAARRRGVDCEYAAAVALGEAIAKPAEEGAVPTVSQLEQQQKGLKLRAAAAHEAVLDRKGKFRSAVVQLVRTCAVRCAEDYARLTKEQAWCHQQLALAQDVAGDAHPIVDGLVWNRYFVPASYHILALRTAAREENSVLALMSADRLSLSRDRASGELIRSGHKLFGDWPL